ncbi:4018_t:CDS:2 [Funneliformis caledonium]|uniref:4018_t:CDS:1 n=1 Tax=Funneliformis caledonium TaxID=1117310 RepID=A0A9N8WF96_9GLOM|nr:4018_t:CDS:2 [Funneliformis caledonium]
MLENENDYDYPANMYDPLLIDLHSKDLHETVSKELKTQYLSDTQLTELKEINGMIFGPNLRVIISLPVTIKKKTKNVHFILDTVSPKTYICEEVYESFKLQFHTPIYQVFINNKRSVAYLPPIDSHFTEINILGMEYLKSSGTNLSIILTNDYDNVTLQFDHEKKEIFTQLQITFQVDPNVLGKILGTFLLVIIVSVAISNRKPGFFLLIAAISLSYNIYKSCIEVNSSKVDEDDLEDFINTLTEACIDDVTANWGTSDSEEETPDATLTTTPIPMNQ